MVFASIFEHAISVFIFASTSSCQIFLASSEHFKKIQMASSEHFRENTDGGQRALRVYRKFSE